MGTKAFLVPTTGIPTVTPIPPTKPIPTASTSTVAPIPTVVPDLPEFQNIGESGMRTLWVAFVIMVLASAAFAAMSWRVPISKRLFHIVTTLITIIASLSYFAMATGHGASYHHIKIREPHPNVPDTYHDLYRQVFWARYIDSALTTSLIILNLGFLAGLNGAYILLAILADLFMVFTGTFAAFAKEGTPQKWGWFAIACISYLVLIWHLVLHGRASARSRSDKVGKFFDAIAGYTLIVWTAYPIIWAVGDLARKMSVSSEVIAYAVLDILSKPVFGAWLLLALSRVPEANLEIGGFWTSGVSGEGTLRLGDDDGA